MEFNRKLQELRKQKGMTQNELAEALYVSRTTVSKWESGRGYPNIDSLKAMAILFSVTVDELLSGDELLTLAEENSKQREKQFCDLLFGLLDISVALFLFIPVFASRVEESINAVSLLSLGEMAPYLRIVHYILTVVIILWGILTLALQNCSMVFWVKIKNKMSLVLSAIGVIWFIVSLQPYAAIFLFVLLVIKTAMLVKRR